MLAFSAIRKCSAALTTSVETHGPRSRRVRRPRLAGELTRKHLVRKRVLQRRQQIAAKENEVKRSMEEITNARDVVIAQLADRIFSKGHRHVASATNMGFVPDGNPATPLVALAGRGKCGKTSLLRSLFRSSAEVSRSNRQLRRDAMNFFNVGGVFNVVDLPGCGGTSVPWSAILQHAILLRNFARCQPNLKMLYYCMDVHYKHGVYVQDIDLLRFLSREVPNFTIVLTKGDQVNEAARGMVCLADIRKELLCHDIQHPVLVTSAFHMGGIDTLRYDMTMNCLHALPTERLTLTEAGRLSERLFSQKELGTIRPLVVLPTQAEEEAHAWSLAVQQDERDLKPKVQKEDSPRFETHQLFSLETVSSDKEKDPGAVEGLHSSPTGAGADIPPIAVSHSGLGPHEVSLTDHSAARGPPATFSDRETQLAYERVCLTLQKTDYMNYIAKTSPWRNPLKWPHHVIPTKHPKANIMRCPGAVENPYLSQAQFVVPRADMYFRRPNIGVRKSSQKGRYEADQPLSFLVKDYTIPYFPDIVDVDMHPLPWTFLGSREAYFERSGGRQLGVRLSQYATSGTIEALSSHPASHNPDLSKEVEKLETTRYGAPIAMLRPPEAISHPCHEQITGRKDDSALLSATPSVLLPQTTF